MTPVRTARSNMVYRGPTPEVKDLHCERVTRGVIQSTWWLTPAERAAIAGGANIGLVHFGEPIQPITLAVVDEQGVGEDAPELLERLELLRMTPECDHVPPGRPGCPQCDPHDR